MHERGAIHTGEEPKNGQQRNAVPLCLCASVPQRLSPAGTPPAARAQAHACEAANTGLRARGALYYLRGKCWELGSSRR